MSWTAATFKARWPEFAPTDDAVVTASLADAVTRVDLRLFGADTDEAVGLMAAHILATSPYGQQARLTSDKADTTYNREFRRLARVRAGGPWNTGQFPC